MSSSMPSGSMPAGRTGYACEQCRQRKQKCGGFTDIIKCRPCTKRKVKCSFEKEVNNPRYNPYLHLRSSDSPSYGIEGDPSNDASRSLNQTALTSAATGHDDVNETGGELPNQVKFLNSRITDLERQLVETQRDQTSLVNARTPRPGIGSTMHSDAGPSQRRPSQPPITSIETFSSPGNQSIASLQGTVITDGPLKAVGAQTVSGPMEYELHDPIERSILSEGEAFVIFKLYFSRCHANAPFLDASYDSDHNRVRSSSGLLFLAILCVGARFWSASAKTSCWLHPRYSELIRLLDAEMMRVTLHPIPEDQKLETVQALMLSAHWMPFDLSPDRKWYRSRFSESGAWQCLGLAIRWATSLALERNCHFSFQRPEMVTRADVQSFRTMLYLIESDHYLALSARRASYLNPDPFNDHLSDFLHSSYVQTTDIRLASLFRVAYAAHFTGCRPTTAESVEAFDMDVQLIERNFTSDLSDESADSFSKHFPYTSLRWYRLSFACAFLDATDATQRTGKVLTWAVEWASQILMYLSRPPLGPDPDNTAIPAQLEPEPKVVEVMSSAIDHYFVVVTYAAFFLVNSWLSGIVNMNLEPRVEQNDEDAGDDAVNSLLFRLVDLAARTLEATSCHDAHLAQRYVPFLQRMTGIIISGNTQGQRASYEGGAVPTDGNDIADPLHMNLEEGLWEMWQQAGLDPIGWPSMFDDMNEG